MNIPTKKCMIKVKALLMDEWMENLLWVIIRLFTETIQFFFFHILVLFGAFLANEFVHRFCISFTNSNTSTMEPIVAKVAPNVKSVEENHNFWHWDNCILDLIRLDDKRIEDREKLRHRNSLLHRSHRMLNLKKNISICIFNKNWRNCITNRKLYGNLLPSENHVEQNPLKYISEST